MRVSLRFRAAKFSFGKVGRRRGSSDVVIGCESLEGRELLAAHAFSGVSELRLRPVRHVPMPPAAFLAAQQKLSADLNSMAGHAQFPPSAVSNFLNDVTGAGNSVRRSPSRAALGTLQSALAANSQDLSTLENDAAAVLASEKVPSPLIAQIGNDFQTLISAPGLTSSDTQTIGNDLVTLLSASGPRR